MRQKEEKIETDEREMRKRMEGKKRWEKVEREWRTEKVNDTE